MNYNLDLCWQKEQLVSFCIKKIGRSIKRNRKACTCILLVKRKLLIKIQEKLWSRQRGKKYRDDGKNGDEFV